MVKRVVVCLLVVLFAVSVVGLASADKIKGTVAKVEEGGKAITVKSADGKEVTVKVSKSKTKFKGIGSRDDLAEGQNVTVTYEGDAASQISVKK